MSQNGHKQDVVLDETFPLPHTLPPVALVPTPRGQRNPEKKRPVDRKVMVGARVVWKGLGAGVGLGLGGCQGEGQAVEGRSRLGEERLWFRV